MQTSALHFIKSKKNARSVLRLPSPYFTAQGGKIEDIQLKLDTNKPENVTITLPKGFSYSDGSLGEKSFKADNDGIITVSGLRHDNSVAAGHHLLIAQHQHHKVCAALIVGEIAIPLPDDSLSGAFSPDGKLFYTAVLGGPVTVLDTAQKIVVAEIDTPGYPSSATCSPDGKHLYVAHYYPDGISVFNTQTYALERSLPVTEGESNWVALNPGGDIAYAETAGGISVYDTLNNKDLTTIATNGKVIKFIFNANGFGYGAIFGGGVVVINTSNHTVVKTISLNGVAQDLTGSTDGKTVYVATDDNNWGETPIWISVIDTTSNTLTGKIEIGATALSSFITSSPSGEYLYILAGFRVGKLHIKSNVLEWFPLKGYGTLYIAISPDGEWIYVSLVNSSAVTAIRVANTLK